MGDCQESMHLYVERDLRKMFSPAKGWKIEENPSWDYVSFDYQVWRKRFGDEKRYPVDVVIAPAVDKKKAAEFGKEISDLRAKGVVVDTPVLFVPTGADVSAVPPEVRVRELKVLKVEAGKVIWWRKSLAS